jgi:tRNA A37 threonylcarbamoyladenosine synthetase subunit TsaC/SUA5/YrdC
MPKVAEVAAVIEENYARYFPKGYSGAPGAESVLEPHVNEAIVFEDFFTVGLRMPPHPVLSDILRKFRVQLHQLAPNAIHHSDRQIYLGTHFLQWLSNCRCIRATL